MKPRFLAILGSAVLFSQIANSQASSSPHKSRDVLSECTFAGNSDFYGIGVRLGFYFQWFSGLIAFVVNPEDSDAQADAQTIFLLANLIALIILQVQDAADVNVVVPILLFYMFFGGSVSAVTSATTSLQTWKKAITTRKIALAARQIFVQLTFLATLGYSFYFWTEGFKKFKRFPDACGGTYVFPVPHRVSLETPSAGSVLALLLLVVLILLIWFVSYKRLRRSFPSHTPAGVSKFAFNHCGEDTPLPPWEGRQLHWTLIGGSLISLVIIWSIAGIELTLKWNHVTDVNNLGSTGQLIPFIIGVASFPPAIWGAFENWEEVKEEESHEMNETKVESQETQETQELLRSPKANEQSFAKEHEQS